MAGSAMIGALRVDLGLNSAEFQKGLKGVQSNMAGFQKSMAGISVTMKAALSGFIVGAASSLTFGAAINGAKQALDAFGNIADKAAQAGLGTDMFQGLTTFASQSGVAIDEVSSALNTFAKNSGLAAVGKGKLVSTLQKLNPELLRNLQLTSDQEERMRLAADAIASARSASERAALSTALFGDAGAKMAIVFQGGAQALDAWMNKARDMGLIVDRDIIAKADAMGDSFDIAAQILDTQLKTAFVNIAPLMVDAARFAADVAKAINSVVDATRELGNRSREGLERQRADLMQLLGDATSLGDMNADPMRVGLPVHQVEEMKAQLATIDAELRRRAMDDLRVRLSELPKLVDDTAGTVASKVNLEPLDLGLSSLADSMSKVNEAGQELGATLADAFSSFTDAVLSGVPAIEALGDVLGDLGKQLLSSSINGFFTNLFGGGFGGNAFGGLRSVGGMALYADGGVTNKPAIFGDAGPEAAVPLPDGRTIPVTLSGNMGGAGRLILELSPEVRVRFLDEAARNSVTIVDKKVPSMIDSRAPAAVMKTRRDGG